MSSDIFFDSDNHDADGYFEKVLEENSENGLKWTCKFFVRDDCVYLSWNFEWDTDKYNGVEGKFIGSYKRYHTYENKSKSIDGKVEKFEDSVEMKLGTVHETSLYSDNRILSYKLKLNWIPRDDFFDHYFTPSELTDSVLVVDGKKMHVSKVFLSFHSLFFRSLFFSEFKEKTMDEIPILDVKYTDFALLLATIYPESIRPTDKSCEKLLELADRFMMKEVTNRVHQHLLEKCKMKSIEILILADKYRLEDVMEEQLKNFETKKQIKSIPEHEKLSSNLESIFFKRLMKLA